MAKEIAPKTATLAHVSFDRSVIVPLPAAVFGWTKPAGR
jgi:hypothetical protein